MEIWKQAVEAIMIQNVVDTVMLAQVATVEVEGTEMDMTV